MTPPAGSAPEVLLPPSQVEELLRTMVKALRATQIYLPNNPIYQRAVESVRTAFRPIWEVLSDLTLSVTESEFIWEEQVVYRQTARSESLAWTLYKDGLRLLTFRPGAEQDEVIRFLEVVNKVRGLPADAEDDLLTLLWEQDFELVHYLFSEVLSDAPAPVAAGGPPMGFTGGGGPPPASAEDAKARNREAVAEDAAQEQRPGVVRIDDFDSTLYFLDDQEVAYIAKAVEKEYSEDLRANVLAFLCDLFEIQTATDVRDEILGILESFPAYLLASGDLRAVAGILRETKVLALRSRGLEEQHRKRLDTFARQLSEPAAVNELLRALDESQSLPPEAELQELFRELQGTALEPVMMWLPRAANAAAAEMLSRVVAQLAEANPAEVLRILGSPESEALAPAVALAGRLRLQPAVPGLAQTLSHVEPAIRLATVQALAEIASPGAFSTLERAVGDADREVRLTAVRALGAKGQRGVLKAVEAVVLARDIDERDLTERQAFFDAYALIAGAAAVAPLAELLHARGGLFKRKVSGDTRACAVTALAKIKHPDVAELLQAASQDKDAVVRNAAGRALREGGR